LSYDFKMVRKPSVGLPGWASDYDDPGYFQSSGAGIAFLGGVLFMTGAMIRHDIALPEWPPDEGAPDAERLSRLAGEYFCYTDEGEQAPGYSLQPTGEEVRRYEAYQKELQRVLVSETPTPSKIADIKFGRIAGWLVTEREANTISMALRECVEVGMEAWLATQPASQFKKPAMRIVESDDSATEFLNRFRLFNELATTHGGYRIL
jgi:hypothetical protein